MLNKTYHMVIIFCAIVLLFGLIIFAFHLSKQAAIPLDEAVKHYNEGVNAQDMIQRDTAFNKALSIYHSIERDYNPIHGNGKLYNNIAQTYFQLELYPQAAYYFYQAQALAPRDKGVEERLDSTINKIGIKPADDGSIFRSVFFFHYYLSLPERLLILFVSIFLIFLLASVYVWKEQHYLKGLIALLFLIALPFLGSVLYTKYMEPLAGVVVSPTMLYSGSDKKSTYVEQKPILGGNKIEVMDVVSKGEWLKIRTGDGKIGFVESQDVGLLKI
jgi:tetratricopeptide (TPR) repeat protein